MVELHIDELVLQGFAASDRYRIAAAIEQELAQLVREHGLPAAIEAGSIAALNAGGFDVAANATPRAIGKHVAQAVYRAMTQP